MPEDPGLTSPPRVGCCNDVRLLPHQVPPSSGSNSQVRAIDDAVAIVSVPGPSFGNYCYQISCLLYLHFRVFWHSLRPKFLCPTTLRSQP